MELVAVIQMNLQPRWFQLDSERRAKLRARLFEQMQSHPDVKFRWYDADPWTGGGTEILVCEFADLPVYWSFWSVLREHALFQEGYAEFDRVFLGYERPLSIGLVET